MVKSRISALPIYYLVLLVLLYIPIGVLFLFSVNDGVVLAFPLKGLTTHWYQDMFGNTELVRALGNSAVVAFNSSVLATALGTAAAIALVRFNFRGKGIFLAVALMPLLVPFLILGVALLILFSALDIERSLVTVAIAHTIISLPYTLLIMMSRLVGFDANLEEAARDLGATYPYILRRVIVPLIAPAMVAAWLVAFTVSFDEFVLASFLNGGKATLPVYIFGQLRFANRFPQVVALAVVVMMISIILFIVSERLQRIGIQASENRRLGQVAI
jgi:spermidine/putrescine transport system permease protein